MTTIEVKYTLADSCLTQKALVCSTVIPTLGGCGILLLIRYALHAWPSDTYATPTASKTMVVWAIVLLTAAVIWRPVFEIRRASKEHFLATYLKDRSVLHQLLSGQLWIRFVSLLIAFSLAALVYVVMQTYSAIDIGAITVACAAGLLCSQLIGYLATDSLKQHVTALLLGRIRRSICLLFALLAIVASTLAQGTASRWSDMTETEVVDRILLEEVHPVPNVQRAVRVMKYGDVTLLQVRDTMPFPFGWVVYLCLVAPQTIPLYAIVCIFLGCDPRTNCQTLPTP